MSCIGAFKTNLSQLVYLSSAGTFHGLELYQCKLKNGAAQYTAYVRIDYVVSVISLLFISN